MKKDYSIQSGKKNIRIGSFNFNINRQEESLMQTIRSVQDEHKKMKNEELIKIKNKK